MKKVFTIDTIIASLMGAIGYGAGYVIPNQMGYNSVVSLVICLVAGTILDNLADKMVYNKFTQGSKGAKRMVFAGIIALFLATGVLVYEFFSHSLWSDFGEQLFYVVGIPAIALGFSLIVRMYKRYKLSAKYGTGEGGFVFDKKMLESLDELKGKNQKLTEYTGKDPVVKTHQGTFVGKQEKRGVSFLGIPYARASRFEKPIPIEDSEDIYEAYYFGDSEIQPKNIHNVLSDFPQSEDCLSLNIWTAKLSEESKKPVFVYIHGGDGRYGGTANPIYHLQNIAKEVPDAVFVSVNYRFGVFGVIDFSATDLPDAGYYNDSTALSLYDQIEALKWIKRNISAFGGDSDNITVAGDSAGGSSILLLSGTKEAKGLFNKAFIMCASTYDVPADTERASAIGKNLVESFSADSVSDLKNIEADKLREFTNKNYDWVELPPRDGRLVPSDLTGEFLKGAAADIEFIFGIASDDLSAWEGMVAGEVSIDAIAVSYFNYLKETLGEEKANKVDELLKTYIRPGVSATEAKKIMLAEYQYKMCPLYDALSLAIGGSKVRCFYWDVKGDIEKFTANAVSMVTSVLGNLDIAEQMGYLHDDDITTIMQALVDKFIHGQEPGLFNNEKKGVKEIVWDEYDDKDRSILHIKNNSMEMKNGDFLKSVWELGKLVFDE